MKKITLTINGNSVVALVEPRQHLADFLRENLFLTGTHLGCEHGVCGSCTVEIDGKIARSCITYAVQCDGAEVRTIESFDDDPLMERLRAAFTEEHALQCGYCTPGMLITARDLVQRMDHGDEQRIREEMSGNLCRCTGYVGIVAAIRRVIEEAPDISVVSPSKATGGPAPRPSRAWETQQAPDAALAKPVAPAPTTAEAAEFGESFEMSDTGPEGVTTLRQTFVVGHTPTEVWRFFGDLRAVARCMPGASVTTIKHDRVLGEIRVKLGPITAAFAGEGRVSRDDATRRATIVGRGRDARSSSRAWGRIDYAVSEAEDGARVDVEVGYALTGRLGQFSRGSIVRDLVNRLTVEFAKNLETRLADSHGKDWEAEGADDVGEPAALKAGGLIWSMIWMRLRRVFGDLFGRH